MENFPLDDSDFADYLETSVRLGAHDLESLDIILPQLIELGLISSSAEVVVNKDLEKKVGILQNYMTSADVIGIEEELSDSDLEIADNESREFHLRDMLVVLTDEEAATKVAWLEVFENICGMPRFIAELPRGSNDRKEALELLEKEAVHQDRVDTIQNFNLDSTKLFITVQLPEVMDSAEEIAEASSAFKTIIGQLTRYPSQYTDQFDPDTYRFMTKIIYERSRAQINLDDDQVLRFIKIGIDFYYQILARAGIDLNPEDES